MLRLGSDGPYSSGKVMADLNFNKFIKDLAKAIPRATITTH